MADTLTFRLLTPQREICDETVAQVTAEGTLGQFGVLPDHIAFLTALEETGCATTTCHPQRVARPGS